MLSPPCMKAQTVTADYASDRVPLVVSPDDPNGKGTYIKKKTKIFGAQNEGDTKFKYAPTSAHKKGKKRNNSVAKAEGEGPLLYGNVIYANSWAQYSSSDQYPYGIYKFRATSDMKLEPIKTNTGYNANGGGTIYDNTFHYVRFTRFYGMIFASYYEIDMETWKHTGLSTTSTNELRMSVSSTYDRTTGNVYGCFYTENLEGLVFGTIDYSTLKRTAIRTLDKPYFVMATDANGQVYGIDGYGTLDKIDKKTGAATTVGSTGLIPGEYMQSATIDPATGKMYWAFASVKDDGGTTSNALYEINTSTGKASLVSTFPDGEEVLCLAVPDTVANDAPGEITDLAINFQGASTSGEVTFTVPTATSKGDVLQGPVTYTILVNGSVAVQQTAMPGAKITETVEAENGMASFVVYVKNDAGESKRAVLKKWIGYDQPVAVSYLTLSIDEATNVAKLTWEAPQKGNNEGVVEPSDLTYEVVRYPEGKVVAQGLTECEFTETLTKGKLDVYYYKVRAMNNGQEGSYMTSNKVVFGNPLEVPYAQDFDEESSMDLITIIDHNKDEKTWLWSSGVVGYKYSLSKDADDWLLLPPLNLKSDRNYFVRFRTYSTTSEKPELLSVSVGKTSNVDDGSYVEVMPTTSVAWTDRRELAAEIAVDESGSYRIGFHVTSPKDHWTLYLDSVRVVEGAVFTAPDSVTNLKVQPGEEGLLEATISFNAPTLTSDGKPLNDIDAINIYRGEKLIHTVADPTTGAAYTYVDEGSENGFNTYKIVAKNSGGDGRVIERKVFVGYDVPLPPESIRLVDNLDNTATLTWDAAKTIGANGGYVDPSSLTYNVYSVNNGNASILEEDVDGTTFKVDMPTTGPQGFFYFALTSLSDLGESGFGVSPWLIQGAPYKMPFKESFPGGEMQNPFWSQTKPNGVTDFILTDETSFDKDNGAAQFLADKPGDETVLGSGKISMEGVRNPQLTFTYYAYPGKDLCLKVGAKLDGNTLKVLKTYDYNTIGGYSGWRTEVLDLNELKGCKYLTIMFDASSNDTQTPITIDAISLVDLLDKDVSVTASAPKQVTAGRELKVTSIVENVGKEKAEGYTARLYVNDKEVAAKEGKAIEYMEKDTISLTYLSKITDPSSLRMKVVVDYASDENTANNTEVLDDVTVVQPESPTVTDLTADKTEQGVELSWTAPAAEEQTHTEDFEGMEAFTTTELGDWSTVFDPNKKMGNWGVTFPHMGEAFGFIVFDSDAVTYDSPSFPQWIASHSGHQFLANFCNYKSPCNDAWLISPYLPGKEQTIKLWAKTFHEAYGYESFEVKYSTATKDTADFKDLALTVDQVPMEWTEYSADLPEGTRYFAVRVTSSFKFMIMFDDITYTTGTGKITGFNIYRDGELLKTVDADAISFTDETAGDESHVYNVTVVYDDGESAFSNDAAVIGTGIDGIQAESKPFDVYSTDGRLMRSKARNTKGLRPGIYVIEGKKVTVK